MIEQIQKFTNQIVNFLADKEGFSTEVTHHGVNLNVTAPSGDVTSYDMYELLLYTMAVRKIGSDIELNINTDDNGNNIFAINTDAKLDVIAEIQKINESFINFQHDTIQSVFIGHQTSESVCPFCVMTLYKNGNWMRHDLAKAEVLYAITHGMKLELDDSAFVFKKLRKLTLDVQTKLKELNDK
ncbi:hypothetical protein ABV23_RS01245 [Escherichia coli]|nr:hypothetical protein [Escherichia coli]